MDVQGVLARRKVGCRQRDPDSPALNLGKGGVAYLLAFGVNQLRFSCLRAALRAKKATEQERHSENPSCPFHPFFAPFLKFGVLLGLILQRATNSRRKKSQAVDDAGRS